jgi:hypothetical protein
MSLPPGGSVGAPCGPSCGRDCPPPSDFASRHRWAQAGVLAETVADRGLSTLAYERRYTNILSRIGHLRRRSLPEVYRSFGLGKVCGEGGLPVYRPQRYQGATSAAQYLSQSSCVRTFVTIPSQCTPSNSKISRSATSISFASDSRRIPLARKCRLLTVSSEISRHGAVSSTLSSSTDRITNTTRKISGNSLTLRSRTLRICARASALSGPSAESATSATLSMLDS